MRTKPYTERGIRQKKCIRCGSPASTQWQICADGNQYRPICLKCDIELNRFVLDFMMFTPVQIEEKMERYITKMREG